jgi:hypothetical protein
VSVLAVTPGQAATADELAHLSYEPAIESYEAACYLSWCVMLARKDGQLAEASRQALAESYGDRALALLRQAVAHGYKDATHMKQDRALEPLHERQVFQKLLADLETKSKD